MSMKWMMAIIFVYMAGILCSTLVEQVWFGQSHLAVLFANWSWSIDSFTSRLDVIGEILTFDFAFFKNVDGTPNDLFVVRWALMAVSVAFWFNIILTMVQSVGSAITKIFTRGV